MISAQFMERIGRVQRPISDTWLKLPEEDQDQWREFFTEYLVRVVELPATPALGGSLAQLWAIAAEFTRFYGVPWDGRHD